MTASTSATNGARSLKHRSESVRRHRHEHHRRRPPPPLRARRWRRARRAGCTPGQVGPVLPGPSDGRCQVGRARPQRRRDASRPPGAATAVPHEPASDDCDTVAHRPRSLRRRHAGGTAPPPVHCADSVRQRHRHPQARNRPSRASLGPEVVLDPGQGVPPGQAPTGRIDDRRRCGVRPGPVHGRDVSSPRARRSPSPWCATIPRWPTGPRPSEPPSCGSPARDSTAPCAAGVEQLAAAGVEWVIVAHGDLPRARDLGSLAPFAGITLVPDRNDDGTNVLRLPVGCDFRFAYGPGSFRTHRAEATRLGTRPSGSCAYRLWPTTSIGRPTSPS